jgi:two-component system response regulator LytT
MSKILIIDDEKFIGDYLPIIKKIKKEINVITTDSSKEALEIAKNNDIKVFFIEINLFDGDGIELAQKIRRIRKYKFAMIVFISSMINRKMEAFQKAHCYKFIDKNLLDLEALKNDIKSIIFEYIPQVDGENNCIWFDFNFEKKKINCDEILFVEYKDRHIYIQTVQEKTEYKYVSLVKMIDNMPSCFVQVNRNYMINKNHIKVIDKKNRQIKLKNWEQYFCYSRSKKKLVE